MQEKIYQDIKIDLDRFRPMGDMVLVKRLPDPEESAGGIHIPESSRNENRPKDPKERVRRGVVVATGPGDTSFHYQCSGCENGRAYLTPTSFHKRGAEVTSLKLVTKCWNCGACDWKPVGYDIQNDIFTTDSTRWYSASNRYARPMHVKIGDIILWERRPQNECSINGQEFTLLHEEQSILAVLESEPEFLDSMEFPLGDQVVTA